MSTRTREEMTNDLKKFVVYEATNSSRSKFYNIFTRVDDKVEYISVVLNSKKTYIGKISFKRDEFNHDYWGEYTVEEYEFSDKQKRDSIVGVFQ